MPFPVRGADRLRVLQQGVARRSSKADPVKTSLKTCAASAAPSTTLGEYAPMRLVPRMHVGAVSVQNSCYTIGESLFFPLPTHQMRT